MFFSFNFFCSSSSSWHSTRGKGFRTKRNRLQREIPCSGKCVWVLRKHPCVNCYTDRVYMTYTHTHCSVPAQLQVAKQYGAYFLLPLSLSVYIFSVLWRKTMWNWTKGFISLMRCFVSVVSFVEHYELGCFSPRPSFHKPPLHLALA